MLNISKNRSWKMLDLLSIYENAKVNNAIENKLSSYKGTNPNRRTCLSYIIIKNYWTEEEHANSVVLRAYDCITFYLKALRGKIILCTTTDIWLSQYVKLYWSVIGKYYTSCMILILSHILTQSVFCHKAARITSTYCRQWWFAN